MTNTAPKISHSLIATFAPVNNLNVWQPIFVTSADVNADGKMDLIMTSSDYLDVISVLLGNGDGTFATVTNMVVGSRPYSVTIADVNGDGKLDLISPNYYTGDISFLLANGDGSFTRAGNAATGLAPMFITNGDVNGDGKMDLVTANWDAQNISVLLGHGDGTFAAAMSYTTTGYSTSLTCVDINADGKLDLVTANNNANTVSVLLGNGDGSFAFAADYSAGTNPGSIATADINNDGKQDLLVTNSSNVALLLGNGDGSFAAASYLTVGIAPSSVTVADVNEDGHLDVVTANGNSDNVTVLLGHGDGSFEPATNFSVRNGDPYTTYTIYPRAITAADFNGDGKPDFVVANSRFVPASIMLNTTPTFSTTAFTEQTPVNPGSSILVSDAEGNWNGGALSVQITSNAETADSIYLPTSNPGSNSIWLDTANGNLLMSGSTQIGSADAASVNNDTAWHLTFNANANDGLVQATVQSLFFNNNSDSPSLADRSVTFSVSDADGLTSTATQTITVTAVNDAPVLSDSPATLAAGTEDVAYTVTKADLLAGWTDDSSSVDLNGLVADHGSVVDNGNGSYTITPVVDYNGTMTLKYNVSDGTVSSVGKLAYNIVPVSDAPILLQRPPFSLSFAAPTFIELGFSPNYVTRANVNGDSKMDLIATDGNNKALLLGQSDGGFSFADPAAYAVDKWMTNGNPVFADLNGDRIVDMLTNGSTSIVVQLGLSHGGYASPSNVDSGSWNPISSFSVADFNRDGKADLMISHNYTSDVSVLLGNGDGSFAAVTNYSMGSNLYYGLSSVTSVDVNGDGKYDLIATDQYSNRLLVSLNEGVLLPPTSTFTEQTPVTLAPYLLVYDADGNWNGGNISVQITGNAEAADSIYLPTSNLGSSGIWLDTTNGNLLMSGSTQIGSADAAAVSNDTAWHFTFNANATDALVQATVRALLFNNSSDAPGVGDRTVTFSVSDSSGLTVSNTQTISITAVDDLPTGSVVISGAGNGYTTPNHWLDVSNTLADVDGMGPISYQWQSNGQDIVGATGSSYRIGYGDIGSMITVVAQYPGAAGNLQSATSSTSVLVDLTGVAISGATLGNDTIRGSNSAQDAISYEDAISSVKVDLMRGIATGGGGNDRLVSVEDVLGSFFGDTITGNNAINMLSGGYGNDSLYGNAGDDVLLGGNGEDKLFGGAGDDILDGAGIGSGFFDEYFLSAKPAKNVGKDILNGGDGNDTYYINGTDTVDFRVIDIIQESAGKNSGIDTVHSTISYTLAKNVENLLLDSNDYLPADIDGTGNTSNNIIVGNFGNNTLNGKQGNDTLTGGEGADNFVFDTGITVKKQHGTLVYSNVDAITDFSSDMDSIILDHKVFSAYKTEFAAASREGMEVDLSTSFAYGDGLKTAANADIHLIYDSGNGNLYYDADGVGGKEAILFLTLVGKPDLTTVDLHIA